MAPLAVSPVAASDAGLPVVLDILPLEESSEGVTGVLVTEWIMDEMPRNR